MEQEHGVKGMGYGKIKPTLIFPTAFVPGRSGHYISPTGMFIILSWLFALLRNF